MNIYNYEEARSIIQNGDIIFFKGTNKSIINSIIMFFTRSKFSHCGIAFWIKTGGDSRLMLVEAQSGTSRRILNFSFYKDREIVIVASPKPWDQIEPKALERIGKEKYSLLLAFYVGIREFLSNYAGFMLPKWKTSRNDICSEFIADVLELPDTSVSPGRLFNILSTVSEVR